MRGPHPGHVQQVESAEAVTRGGHASRGTHRSERMNRVNVAITTALSQGLVQVGKKLVEDRVPDTPRVLLSVCQ